MTTGSVRHARDIRVWSFGLLHQMSEARKKRIRVGALGEMSDHLLRDIGVTRSGLRYGRHD